MRNFAPHSNASHGRISPDRIVWEKRLASTPSLFTHANNATTYTDAFAVAFVAGEMASGYGVRDFSPALGAGVSSPASLNRNNALAGQTAINFLRESGDVPSEATRPSAKRTGPSPHSNNGTSRRRRNRAQRDNVPCGHAPESGAARQWLRGHHVPRSRIRYWQGTLPVCFGENPRAVGCLRPRRGTFTGRTAGSADTQFAPRGVPGHSPERQGRSPARLWRGPKAKRQPNFFIIT
jgi:hypothetical protein